VAPPKRIRMHMKRVKNLVHRMRLQNLNDLIPKPRSRNKFGMTTMGDSSFTVMLNWFQHLLEIDFSA
jgi:hypothetical protein